MISDLNHALDALAHKTIFVFIYFSHFPIIPERMYYNLS